MKQKAGARKARGTEAQRGAVDAGSAPLSAEECERLIDTIVVLSVRETMASDPDVARLTPDERLVTAKLARREALAEPGLVRLKEACPERYTRAQERCILAAKTMAEVDRCSR